MPIHYAGRRPNVSKAFGFFDEQGVLVAVCTFGKPASPSLCVGLMGPQYAPHIYELNRLCKHPTYTGQLSAFVAIALRKLKPLNWVIVSYADTEMNHHGYIYQATNWLYTGATKSRTDKFTEGNKHPRHYQDNTPQKRKVRSSKHRYVYLCSHSKHLKAEWLKNLKYPVQPYPKGDNKYYQPGYQLQPTVLENPDPNITP